VGIAPLYLVVMGGLFLAGCSKNFFDPAVYGYIGQRVGYNQRGLAIGVLEFAWAGSALVGIPIAGFLIQGQGWLAPFWLLGLSAFVCMIFILWFFPKDRQDQGGRGKAHWRMAWGDLVRQRQAVGLLGFVFFASLGNDQLFVVYGAWMEESFKMGVAAIGLGTSVIGAAELIGESLTAALGDRIGLRRATLTGSLLSATTYGLLPFLTAGLSLALAGLFATFLTFEFTMVCAISLSTEALPRYRATMMAAFFGVAGIGRVIGALLGGMIWQAGGIGAVGAASALATLMAGGSLGWGMKNR
jgi:predicted MFS family arabinose efflux permease